MRESDATGKNAAAENGLTAELFAARIDAATRCGSDGDSDGDSDGEKTSGIRRVTAERPDGDRPTTPPPSQAK